MRFEALGGYKMDSLLHTTDVNKVGGSTKPTKAKDIVNINIKVVSILFILVALVLFQQAAFATPWTPLEWQQEGGKLIGWSGDLDENYIQDELDHMDPNEVVDCIVLLNKCVEVEELRDGLGRFGDITYIGKFLTFVCLSGVRINDLSRIAASVDVAMVEWDEVGEYVLDISNPAVRKRTSTTFSPNTVDDAFGFQGTGIGIAVLDSGVDNGGGPGTTHTFLPNAKVTGTYDAVADDDTVDPDDVVGHGTHVAGIALGTGGTAGTFEGVAPDANLIDMMIGSAKPSSSAALKAVEKCIEEQNAWGINVIQTSCKLGGNSNGQDDVSQAFNLAVARGMVVVAAIGNDGLHLVPPPGAGDSVITVSGYNDQGTVPWGDDTLYVDTNFGPRQTDADGSGLDELKPDVSGPAVAITSANNNTTSGTVDYDGTSMAAPHVSGVAALIIEARTGINALSVKDLIKRTANQRGAVTSPAIDPDWNDNWGQGQVDAFAAINDAVVNDPGFPNSPPQCCGCPDVMTATPPKVGVANTLTAVVTNNSTVGTAQNVIVSFGVYIFGNATTFYSIAQRSVDIPASTTINVPVPWTPQASPTGDPHACLMVEIGYGPDTNFANNRCQRNINIQQNSTATYYARIENNLTEPAVMHLQIANPFDDRWTLKVDKNDFHLDPYVCAEVVTMTLDSPPDAEPEEMVAIDFNVIAITELGEEIPHNGFSIIGCVEGGEPPTIEIVEVSRTELDIVLIDDRSGISYVNIIEAKGGEIFVPAFHPGDKEVVLRARAIDSKTANFLVEAWDCAFNTARKFVTLGQEPLVPVKAYNPNPADRAIHQDTWVALSWTPGAYAASHDVYFGDNFAAVNEGAGDTFQGNQTLSSLILGFPGFSYPDGLVPGTTYYWRVDEVDDVEPESPWKGDVWSFTTVVEGLVAYYPFENDTTDISDNGLDGIVFGDPVFVDGAEGMALDFNGDYYVDCGGNVEFSFTDAMTVSTWVNIRSVTTAWMAMVAKGENAWRLAINNETTGIHYAFSGGDRGWQAANTATELAFDEWYHVAATYDTNVGALVYINGVLDASNENLDGIDTNDMPLLLGDNPEATGRFFDGMLDEVKIYNRALSAEEICYLSGLE